MVPGAVVGKGLEGITEAAIWQQFFFSFPQYIIIFNVQHGGPVIPTCIHSFKISIESFPMVRQNAVAFLSVHYVLSLRKKENSHRFFSDRSV